MRRVSLNLTAGAESRGPAGRFFVLTSAALPVDVVFYGPQQQPVGKAEGVKEGFSVDFTRDENVTFAGVICSSAQAVEFLASDFPIRQDRATVKLDRSATVTNNPAVSVGTTAVSVKAANSAHKSVVFFAPTTNTAAVYLGGSGITTATGAIELQPGDHWEETEAAAAAFFAISGTAGQSIRYQVRS